MTLMLILHSAGICGVVKSVMVVNITDPDITYSRVDLTIWTLAEPAVSIIAISIPVLRMLYREIKTSSQRSNGRSRLASNDPRSTTNATSTGTNIDTRKSKGFGFNAKYGRDHASIMSAESQEGLKDEEKNQSGAYVNTGGIMKTEEYSVSVRPDLRSQSEESMELDTLNPARSKR